MARAVLWLAVLMALAACATPTVSPAGSVQPSPGVTTSLPSASPEPRSPSVAAEPTIECHSSSTRCSEALALVRTADLAPIGPDKIEVVVEMCDPAATCPSDFDVLVVVIDRSFRLGDAVHADRVRGGAHADRIEPWTAPSLPEWILPLVRAAADLP